MCDEKWIHMTTRQLPAQWLDWEEAPKYFPKPNLHQKEDHGHCLVVWSTTTLWILVKPLYLRSMLSKWMRCTENCNACSWHWSTESTQFSPSNPQLHIAQPTLQSFASSARMGFPGGTSGKKSTRQCRRCEFDSESGRSPGVGNGNLLQYSCLENPMDRGTCGLQLMGSQKSWTWLSNETTAAANYLI